MKKKMTLAMCQFTSPQVCVTSDNVRACTVKALSLLLRNGAWVREELSAYVCCVIVYVLPRVWVMGLPLLARVQQLALQKKVHFRTSKIVNGFLGGKLATSISQFNLKCPGLYSMDIEVLKEGGHFDGPEGPRAMGLNDGPVACRKGGCLERRCGSRLPSTGVARKPIHSQHN